MNILLLTSHSIAEHDDLQMFSRMPGIEVFSIGAYTNPHAAGDDKRPSLPEAKHHVELEAATHARRAALEAERGAPRHRIDWAKADLAPEVLDWADTIIVHHFPEQWIGGQWDRIRHKRVIWRTCGQSDPRLEYEMTRYRKQGLQVVRYSPKEREAFPRWDAYAGEDVMIRFGKDPDVWTGWTGERKLIGNITQNMLDRGDACGYRFWAASTIGLPTAPAGPGSQQIAGVGPLSYDEMREYLQRMRVYLYTGTRPASYTLGLIEAQMTGIPVVAMGRGWFEPSALYEADEIAPLRAADPKAAAKLLRDILDDDAFASRISEQGRARAIELFDLRKVSREWADFLGTPTPYEGWLDSGVYWEAAA